MKKLIQAGFSMVELIVILAALGGVALIVTKLGKNTSDIQEESQLVAHYADLVRETHFLLGDTDACSASLSGITFKDPGSDITSGIELRSASVSEKTQAPKKIFQGKIGKLEIANISMKVIPDLTPVQEGIRGGKAEIKISGIKSISAMSKTFDDIKRSINITYVTNADGTSTIKNCSKYNQEDQELARVWCGSVTATCLSEGTRVMAIGKYINGKFSGVVHSLEPAVVIQCPALVNQTAQLGSCGK